MTTKTVGSQLTLILKPYSGGPRERKVQDSLRSLDPHQLTMDFEFLTKRESGTEASGAPSMELSTQKKGLYSNLEAIRETLPTQKQTSQFPLWIRTKKQKQHSQTSLDSSLATLINHRSHRTKYQHHLWEQWLTLLQPPLSQAPLGEPPDLEYPPERRPHWEESGTVSNRTLQTIKEIEVLMILGDQTLTVEVGVQEGTPEEGETQEGTPGEGEILGEALCHQKGATD